MVYELAEVKDATKVENNEEVAKIAEELGLEVQARRYRHRGVEDCFTPLAGDELAIWVEYCPTPYWFKADPKKNRMIQDYAFDTIPVPVLRHWKAIRDEFAFENFVIRTTERTPNNDPLLLGIYGTNAYMLARWGAESPALANVKEVARLIVLERVRRLWNSCSVMFESNRPRKVAAELSWYVDSIRGSWTVIPSALRLLGLPNPLRGEDIKALIDKYGA